MHTGYALLAALAVMFVSLLGVVFTAGALGAWMRRYLTYLATFSAGVFLLIAYHLSQEAVEEGGWLVGLAAIALGSALMEGIHFLLPNKHHHHGHSHDHSHTTIDGRRVLVSDALHNVGDGILLVGAFAASTWIGVAATVGVLLHEAVQEISEYFVLREAGYTNRDALTRNFAVSSTILIGVVAAALLSTSPIILALLAGIAAGGFLSVVFHDLLPHAIHSVRTHGHGYVHVAAALFGGVAIFGVQSAFPHEEAHGEDVVETHVENIVPPVSSVRTEEPRVETRAEPVEAEEVETVGGTPMGGAR
jgi:zinc and cadmium transporter